MFNEFDEYADQIASDIPARFDMRIDEAQQIVRCYFAGEPREFQENVASALCRSYHE